MFRLTREVRLAVNDTPANSAGANGYGGIPAVEGFGRYFVIRLTLAGSLDPGTAYLTNIKQMDAAVRERAICLLERAVHEQARPQPAALLPAIVERLMAGWDGPSFDRVELALSPFLCYSAIASELPMVRMSQKFEFSASHRLHSPALSDEENRRAYGKCNNPHGHGHNYEVQVTLSGTPDERGVLMSVSALEQLVAEKVIQRLDHKNLNVEVAEFRELVPSVENIAKVIYGMLRDPLGTERARLAAVTVWETPKTWCEYSEP